MTRVERADGGSAATQASELKEKRWRSRPWIAFGIRAGVFLLPLAASIACTRAFTSLVDRPQGLVPAALYWTVALVVSVFALIGAERVARRFAPLATLFRVSLVFPDDAPSRFGVAMRSGSLRKFEKRLERGEELAPGEAAEELLALVARVGKHDRLTRGHSERVRAYTDMLSEELRLPEEDRDKLRWAALVHDVGKLVVPEEILNKSTRPDDAEWKVLRSHPAAAEGLVEPLRGWLGDWVLAATQHHERYDGKGYPLGLTGEEISPGGRIVAVADAYDVMTVARSYKKPLAPSIAREELARNAGTHFDPRVVRAMLNLSMGRLRLVVGPLGWLNELAWITRIPQAASTAASTGAAALAVTVGVATAAPPPAVEPPPTAAVVEEAQDLADPPVDRVVGPASTTIEAAPEAPPTTPPPALPAPTTPASTAPTMTSMTTTTTMTTAPLLPPTANDDDRTWDEDGGSAKVLANDTPGSGPFNPPTLQIVTPPTQGIASVTGNYRIQFDPDGFRGTTSLVYEICGIDGPCDVATLTMTIVDAE